MQVGCIPPVCSRARWGVAFEMEASSSHQAMVQTNVSAQIPPPVTLHNVGAVATSRAFVSVRVQGLIRNNSYD